MNSRRVQYSGFEANGVEVQLHVDVRMRQKAGTQTTKIKSAKSIVMVHPRKFTPSKYTRYTVYTVVCLCVCVCVDCFSCSRINEVQVRVSIGFWLGICGFAK